MDESSLEQVPLPENRPGRIAVAEATTETGRPRQCNSAPLTKSVDELREMALTEAKAILPNELAMMLPPSSPAHGDIVALCGKDDTWQGFAALLVDLLWAPLAGCVPRLGGLKDEELAAKLQLFWRCAVALCVMPLTQLSMLSRRKASFMPLVREHLPPNDATAADARLAHIRLNLPLFAMVADAPKDDKPKPAPPEKPNQADVEKATADTALAKEDSQMSQKAATEGIKPAETGPQRVDANKNEQPPEEEKTFTAARHTYDVGYKKWESFDVDAEMRKVDKPQPSKPKQQLVDLESYKKQSAVADLDFDDPLKALDQAIQRAREKEGTLTKSEEDEVPIAGPQTVPEPEAEQTTKPKSLSEQYKRWDKFDVDEASDVASDEEVRKKGSDANQNRGYTDPALQSSTQARNVSTSAENSSQSQTAATSSGPGRPETVLSSQTTQDSVIIEELQEPIAVAENGSGADNTTAASLNNEYKKWDAFDPDDEMDDISDDDAFGGDMDLDALTGPKEEVAQIQRHWKREAAACRRKIRKENEEKKIALRQAQIEARQSLPEGRQIQRPCVYRPEQDPESTAAKAIRRDYNKWKDFDVDAAILDLDNEGKTAEGDAVRCEARKGSAMVSAEGYTKDREEFELDQDIEKQVGSLKKVIAQRLKDATALKTEGNSFLRSGRAQDACRMYREGLSTMELCEQASVIMADTMADKNLRLVADLHRNMAAAQLEVGDYEGARESCDAALQLSSRRKDDCGNRDAVSDDDKALYRRALALLRLGRNQDARRDIESLVALRGEDDSAVKKLRAEDRAD